MTWNKTILAAAAFLSLVIANLLRSEEEKKGNAFAPQDRDAEKTKERLNDKAAKFWIYDDLKAARAEARRTRKPILLSFR